MPTSTKRGNRPRPCPYGFRQQGNDNGRFLRTTSTGKSRPAIKKRRSSDAFCTCSARFPQSRLYSLEVGLYHRNACSANTSGFRSVAHFDDFHGSLAEHAFVEDNAIGGTSSHYLHLLNRHVPPSSWRFTRWQGDAQKGVLTRRKQTWHQALQAIPTMTQTLQATQTACIKPYKNQQFSPKPTSNNYPHEAPTNAFYNNHAALLTC